MQAARTTGRRLPDTSKMQPPSLERTEVAARLCDRATIVKAPVFGNHFGIRSATAPVSGWDLDENAVDGPPRDLYSGTFHEKISLRRYPPRRRIRCAEDRASAKSKGLSPCRRISRARFS